MTSQTDPPATLAQRIDLLFRTIHPGRRRPYSMREAASQINTAAGHQVISHGYLWSLRKGTKTNPSIIQIAAIAAFFGVPPSYFFDTPGEPTVDPAIKIALSDDKVREVILRAHGLPEPALRALMDLADSARTLAGLPPITRPDDNQDDEDTSGP